VTVITTMTITMAMTVTMTMTMTVTMTVTVTVTMTDVGGRILETSSRNTMSASKMEIHMVIFSPASAGR